MTVEKQAKTLDEAVRTALREAAANEAQRRRSQSKAETIRNASEEITVLRAKGWSWREIAKALESTLDASGDTIRLAMASPKKPVKTAKAKRVISEPKASGVRNDAEPSPEVPAREFLNLEGRV